MSILLSTQALCAAEVDTTPINARVVVQGQVRAVHVAVDPEPSAPLADGVPEPIRRVPAISVKADIFVEANRVVRTQHWFWRLFRNAVVGPDDRRGDCVLFVEKTSFCSGMALRTRRKRVGIIFDGFGIELAVATFARRRDTPRILSFLAGAGGNELSQSFEISLLDRKELPRELWPRRRRWGLLSGKQEYQAHSDDDHAYECREYSSSNMFDAPFRWKAETESGPLTRHRGSTRKVFLLA
jgi:hypothetical protein